MLQIQIQNTNCQQGNPEQHFQEEQVQRKKHKRLFSRVDYIAGENVRDSAGKFKCGLWVDEDLNGEVDFALA